MRCSALFVLLLVLLLAIVYFGGRRLNCQCSLISFVRCVGVVVVVVVQNRNESILVIVQTPLTYSNNTVSSFIPIKWAIWKQSELK